MATLDEKTPRSPELSEVIRQIVDGRLANLHTALPGSVESYDAQTQEVSVLPLLKRKYANGDEVTLPVIPNVPVYVSASRAGDTFIHLPLESGDTGVLLFFERSIGDWREGAGGAVVPESSRKHALSDAIFIPGLQTTPGALDISDPEAVTMQHGNISVQLNKTGTLKVENSVNELIATLSELVQELLTATVITSLGASPFTAATITSLTAVKVKLDTFKGA